VKWVCKWCNWVNAMRKTCAICGSHAMSQERGDEGDGACTSVSSNRGAWTQEGMGHSQVERGRAQGIRARRRNRRLMGINQATQTRL
jgi:hypothetical protein